MVTDQGIVHYEVLGRGRPVILLHGWLGSWALWRDTMEVLSKEFRTYSLDFFGFGESLDRTSDFSVNNYVLLVNQFMDRLGIPKAPIVGHSMGGTVTLGVALKYPQKAVKAIVIGAPINGESLNFFLKLSGYKGIAHLAYGIPYVLDLFIMALTRFGSPEGKSIHQMVKSDASKVSADSFFGSIGALRKTDLREELHDVSVPILGIYGKRDIIVNPNQSKILLQSAPTSTEAWFDKSGHFPMMDEPQRFNETLRSFLNDPV
jgi:pimeloyl-ACP methyl ester carboxylesterase